MTDTTELHTINVAGHKLAVGTAEDLRGCAIIAEREGDVDAANRFRSAASIVEESRKQNQELKIALSCMTASRDRWKAEAKGKITQEWLRRVAEGDVGEVE